MTKRAWKTQQHVAKFEIDLFLQIPKSAWGFLVKYLAMFQCEECGAYPTTFNWLESHHLDRNPGNNCLANGICLCKHCHVLYHVMLNNSDRERAVSESGSTVELPENGHRSYAQTNLVRYRPGLPGRPTLDTSR
jgi:hypothetical protein